MKDKMTVEEFLAKGYLFVEGDVIDSFGTKVTVGIETGTPLESVNLPDRYDYKRYVISAKALEKGVRTKTTFEKVSFDKLSEAFAEHEKETLYGKDCYHNYTKLDDNMVFDAVNEGFEFYRKVETEITPMQAAKRACEEFISSTSSKLEDEFFDFLSGSMSEYAESYDKEFVEACRAIVNAYDGECYGDQTL